MRCCEPRAGGRPRLGDARPARVCVCPAPGGVGADRALVSHVSRQGGGPPRATVLPAQRESAQGRRRRCARFPSPLCQCVCASVGVAGGKRIRTSIKRRVGWTSILRVLLNSAHTKKLSTLRLSGSVCHLSRKLSSYPRKVSLKYVNRILCPKEMLKQRWMVHFLDQLCTDQKVLFLENVDFGSRLAWHSFPSVG